MDGVDVPRLVRLVELLQRALDLLERTRVEQLAQLRFAEQLTELRLVDGRPPSLPAR